MANVLYIFGGEKASGAEIVIERLMRANPNVQPHLFIAPGAFADRLRGEKPAFPVLVLPELRKLNRSSTGALRFYWKAIALFIKVSWLTYRYVKTHGIRYVHANTIVPASYLLPLIFVSKVVGLGKVTWVWSDHDLKYFAKLDHALAKACVRYYHVTLAVSQAVKDKYGVNAKVHVLYNGLDSQLFKPCESLRTQFRQKHGITPLAPVIGIAAVISPRKGQWELIEVFNDLQKRFPDIRLLIAGGYGEDAPAYSAQVKQAMQSNAAIEYLGKVHDMVSFYNACDVVVNNSSQLGSEPLGTTIYEAMACGRTVIASNIGGTPEIIDHQVNGYLFRADSKTCMQEILEQCLQQPLDQLTTQALAKVESKFTLPRMINQYNQYLGIA